MEKSKAKKILIWSGIVAGALLGLALIPTLFKKKTIETKPTNTGGNTGGGGGNTNANPNAGTDSFPLMQGSKGSAVVKVQKYMLKKLADIQLDPDRVTDTKNYASTLAQDLVADGGWGAKTQKAFEFVFPSVTEISYTTYFTKGIIAY